MPVIQSVGPFNQGCLKKGLMTLSCSCELQNRNEGTYRSQSPFEPVVTYLLGCVGRADAPCHLGKMNVLGILREAQMYILFTFREISFSTCVCVGLED